MSQMPRIVDPPPNFAKHMGKSERDKGEQKPIPEIIHDIEHKKTYVRGKFLGKGGFAKCYELKTSDNKILAGKIISKSILVKDHHRQKIASEIELHRDLKHKYVVGFFSYFEDDAFVYIILELCSKKSLMELIKRRRYLTEIECRYFFHQIMVGVAYLHDNSIIHRDLKLGNIFITEDMMVKIGDFGLATRVAEGRKMTLCGTPNYIAPEVLSKTGHSLEVDIWSCGCILYTFFTGKPPFETATLKETYHKIKSGDYAFPPNKIASLARSLISKMLQVNPKNRPSCKQVLSNEWMKGYIPAALPASCLTMPPRALEKAFPNINNPKRVLADQNHKPSSPVVPQPMLSINGKPNAIPKGVRREKENAVGYSSPSQQKNDINNKVQQQEFSHRTSAAHYMKILTAQLKELLNTAPTSAKRAKLDDDSEAPNLAPMLWVSKWVDYSDKYGFGYQLSDDSIGVNFNDLTKMVILCDQFNIRYFDKDGNEEFFTKEKYPTDHAKKIKLLNYFQQYMSENLLKAGASLSQNETGSMARLPNMWTWFRTSRAVVMILSNGTLQINNFRDHTKMILCPLMSAITLLEDNHTMRTYKFESIGKYGCTDELGQKLTYALEKLEAIAAKTENAIGN